MIESLPHVNTPDVFGLHPNAEIGYYTNASKEMWSNLILLQPNMSDSAGGTRRENIISNIANDILQKLPDQFDIPLIQKVSI
jgi:dynein heavy chain